MTKKKAAQQAEAVERPWAFGIGQKVVADGAKGEVTWRRENGAGDREYQVRTDTGESWVSEAAIKASK